MEVFLILRRLVSIPSIDNETEVQLYIQSLLTQLGFRVALTEVYPGRPNLRASRGTGGPLIASHADTFPRGDHADPFHLRDIDGKFSGRGAIDAKGQIAALIKALSLTSKPCEVLITVDEEKDGRGSEIPTPAAEGAIVLEPTSMGIAVAQAGFLESEITVHGKSAHGAIPEAGANAILKAFELFEKMKDLACLKATHPLFPAPAINLQAIKGGGLPSVVPSTCMMQTDMPILPGVDLAVAKKEFDRFLRQQGATYRIIDSSAPIEVESSARVVSTLMAAVQQATGKTAELVGMRSWTDAANIAQQGTPAVVFGAGELALAHSDREAVDTDELETLASVLAAFLDLW